MADRFVDAAAVGAGDGTTPANAFVSVSSVTWGAGDRVWVRNTHYELLTQSMFIGPQSFTVINSYTQWGMTIGWPQAGDPFFDERPAAGVSASWDADIPGTACYSLTGNKFPTIAGSTTGNAGYFLPQGGAVYNMCLQNNASAVAFEPWVNGGVPYKRWLDNVVMLMNSGTVSDAWNSKIACSFGKLTMVLSSTTGFANVFNIHAKHLVVGSRSLISTQLFRTVNAANPVFIGLLEIQAGSMAYLLGRNNTANICDDQGEGQFHIGRIAGKKPTVAISSLGIDCYHDLMVDDYYGEGPVLGGILSTQHTRVASVNEAACDIGSGAVNAMIYEVNSNGAIANIAYSMPSMKRPVLRKYFDVVSGTAIQIRVPIYVDATGTFSPPSGQHRSYLQAMGAVPNVCVRSTLLPGTPAAWTGSLITGGNAYLWTNTFVPAESGTVPFEVYLGWPTQAVNGTAVKGQAYFGEPYKV